MNLYRNLTGYQPWSFEATPKQTHSNNHNNSKLHMSQSSGSMSHTSSMHSSLGAPQPDMAPYHSYWASPVQRPFADWPGEVDPLNRSSSSDKFGLGSSNSSSGGKGSIVSVYIQLLTFILQRLQLPMFILPSVRVRAIIPTIRELHM